MQQADHRPPAATAKPKLYGLAGSRRPPLHYRHLGIELLAPRDRRTQKTRSVFFGTTRATQRSPTALNILSKRAQHAQKGCREAAGRPARSEATKWAGGGRGWAGHRPGREEQTADDNKKLTSGGGWARARARAGESP